MQKHEAYIQTPAHIFLHETEDRKARNKSKRLDYDQAQTH